MIALGIESTAHTFGISIINEKKVLSNCRSVFTTEKGGMIPSEVADHHFESFSSVLSDALEKAKVKLKEIDLISFSQLQGALH